MEVCDRCLKEKVEVTINFKTKKFDICKKCALKIINWLEKKPGKIENAMDLFGGNKY